jgi:hypothetical protein
VTLQNAPAEPWQITLIAWILAAIVAYAVTFFLILLIAVLRGPREDA